MAKPGSLPVGRYFLGLAAILVVLYTIVFWPGQRHTPKLGLDLIGGTQIIFTAHVEGGGTPSSSSMAQAKEIITERVNGSGVTESTVLIQGSNQIVVSIPGATDVDPSTLGATAKLNFRGVVAPPALVTCAPATATPSSSTTPSPAVSTTPSSATASGNSHSEKLLTPTDTTTKAPGTKAPGTKAPGTKTPGTKTPAKNATKAPTAAATPSTAITAPATGGPCTLKSVAQLKKLVKELPDPKPAKVGQPYTSPVYIAGGLSAAVAKEVDAQLSKFDCSTSQAAPDPVNDYYIACDAGAAYLLGPIVVAGTQITTASAVPPSFSSGGSAQWTVSLGLKADGQKSWGNYTSAHNVGGNDSAATLGNCGASATPCADFVAFTLDGNVLSTPVNETAINGGNTQISGSFTQTSAKQLAQQLKYGALPLNFTADTARTISATLGTSQLKAGLLAGGIGLILVVLYSLLYYRALGLVTIASLLVSAGLVYGSIVMLGTQMGFTLSLSGIAGFIVAVGITTDSFVVFFERIKDEVHEGRSVRVAIPRAWIRARRTVLSADTVSVLAAATLYYFAAGDVKGFAFTLGLSTILDVIVVFLFTHPLISLLSRMKAFGTGRFTGLAHIRDGEVVTEAPARASVSVGAAMADDAESPAERPKATGSGGSAAERAAARQARRREEGER